MLTVILVTMISFWSFGVLAGFCALVVNRREEDGDE